MRLGSRYKLPNGVKQMHRVEKKDLKLMSAQQLFFKDDTKKIIIML